MEIDKQILESKREILQKQLSNCLSFWLENGFDAENGGIFTCLDTEGGVYSTDKSVWMQGRTAWMFSHLCNIYGSRDEWRNAAKSCLDFMEAHCINRQAGGRMYFTVTAEGNPLRQRRYCFSEAFYAIANAEYYALTKQPEYLERAKWAYNLVWQLNNGLIKDPTGLGPKIMPETRSGRSLADPMIYLNTSATMRRCDPENRPLYDERAKASVEMILKYHRKPELKATLETVGMDGEFWADISAGRVVNPGHNLECCWFLLQEAEEQGDEELRNTAIEMFDWAYSAGWDKQFGGIKYYIDALGRPPEAYEHDMKLWWPHAEMLIASLMIYRDTGKERYWNLFNQTLEYSLKVFNDKADGEWVGYLRREGKPTEPASKGSTFKGPFHLPRMLVITEQLLADILKQREEA